MFFSRCLLGSVVLMLLIFSCKKEHSQEGRPLPEQSWEFTEAGQLYNGPVDSVTENSGLFKLQGSMHENPDDKLILTIAGAGISTGTYSGSQVSFQFIKGGVVIFHNDPLQSADISIVIDDINADQVSETFSGSVMDFSGQLHTIVEGKFQAAINPNQQTGKLTVWSKKLCSGNNGIQIKVGGLTGELSQEIAAEPACGAEGTALFTLPYGTYKVEAICGTDINKYDVTISSECSFLEVSPDFIPVDYLPLGSSSFWEYEDVAHNSVHQTLTAGSEETLGGKTYTKLTGTRGNFYYYRKELPDYFQYRTLSFQDFVGDPPSVEIIILKDNLGKGERWETEPITLTISGIVQKVKLVSTIVDRGYSDTFNGVVYNDLIKVNTELFFSPDGIGYATSGSAFNTVFSKGYGIVNYNDWDINIEWGIKNVSVVP